VEVDGPGRPGALVAREVAEQVEELVDGVGGQVGGDREAGADRAGGVGPVDERVVGGAAGPGAGGPADHPDLGLDVRAGLAQGRGHAVGRLGQPGVQGRRVAAVRAGVVGDLPLRLGDGLAGADGQLHRPQVAADVAQQLGQGPVGGGAHRHRQVGAGHDVAQQAGLGDHLVAEPVMGKAGHDAPRRLLAVAA
jgi:hypothetical protein